VNSEQFDRAPAELESEASEITVEKLGYIATGRQPPTGTKTGTRGFERIETGECRAPEFDWLEPRNDLGLVSRKRVKHRRRWRRDRTQHEVAVFDREFYSGGPGRLESF
jgi:hypothetical protein